MFAPCTSEKRDLYKQMNLGSLFAYQDRTRTPLHGEGKLKNYQSRSKPFFGVLKSFLSSNFEITVAISYDGAVT